MGRKIRRRRRRPQADDTVTENMTEKTRDKDNARNPESTHGRLTTRILAMPADTNPSGDIFGGWVLSQMDNAAGICAGQRAQGRVVTVAVDRMSFIRPVRVGDILGVYTCIESTGTTSVVVNVEAWVRRGRIGNREKVTEGKFKFVALDENGKSMPLPPEDKLPAYVRKYMDPGG